MFRKLFAIAVVTVGAQSAQAALIYDFSYDFGGGQSIAGQLQGDLQGDGNTIHVSEVLANIVTSGGNFLADTGADYFADRNLTVHHDTFGIVSLNGLLMDFILHRGAHTFSCGNVDSVCLVSGINLASVGGSSSSYVAGNWRIGERVSVPEPTTLGLLGLGLLGLGFARRSRRTA